MRADWDFDALALFRRGGAVILIERQLVRITIATFVKREFGMEGKQSFRIDVRHHRVIRDEQLLQRVRCLRAHGEHEAIMIEIFRARLYVEECTSYRRLDAGQKHLVVQLLTDLER